MKVWSRLWANPSVSSVQVKKNGLSERISQEERKRQEVGAAVPELPLVCCFQSRLACFLKTLITGYISTLRWDANQGPEASASPHNCSTLNAFAGALPPGRTARSEHTPFALLLLLQCCSELQSYKLR